MTTIPMVDDQELNELKREFLEEAQEKVREMQSAPLERLAYLAHQLKGSGGSYGYETISADAAEIEKAVETISDGEVPPTIVEKIKQHVGNLRAEIDRRAAELH